MKTVMAFAAAFAALPALAHNLWVEPAEEGGLRALYGEPEIRLYERSPGKLDALVLVRAETSAAGAALPWRKSDAGFVVGNAGAQGDVVVEARAAAVRTGVAPSGPTQALYYARHAAWPLKPLRAVTVLDIVPTAQPNTFAVSFNGAPLTKGTLKVIAPSLWLQVHDIDERGLVRIHTPWRGLYVLDVDTREQRSGEVAGQHYDTVVHRTTLSFTKPDGPAFENPRSAQYISN